MLKRFFCFLCIPMLVACSAVPVSLSINIAPDNLTIRQGETKTIDITVSVDVIDEYLLFSYRSIPRLSQLVTLTSNDSWSCKTRETYEDWPIDYEGEICSYTGNQRNNFTTNFTMTINAGNELDIGTYQLNFHGHAYSGDKINILNFNRDDDYFELTIEVIE